MNPADHIDANVPEDIRNFSIWFCKTYWINGICDPMYVCNITAMHLGRGDGQGRFEDGLGDGPDDRQGRSGADVAYRRLYGAYTTCIIESGQDHLLIHAELAKLRAL